ncbi:restriction system protein [Streptomyces zhaozhouensis]|uniref:Restriction system protein n=1 Tax=Streptomyces zhaozhouensis TaxID=1300267 RepID=A0A286E858_9ACTN|nr:restriction endonuclease [Streptomyces zhaozhouensis]SOD67108.1 restriction system protein [Streptomyces zhaozhouensis]
MGTALLLALAAMAVGTVAAGLVRAGRREARAEKTRLAEQAQRQARQSLEAVWKMSDRDFEEYIADLCRRDGCTDVQRVGGTGDLGADVIGYLPDSRKIVVQCKRYAKHRSVGSRDIQTFNGTARAEHGADVPIFVASCVFTAPARKFAARQHLTLIDINLLGFWNSGAALSSLLDLDIDRSGTNRKLTPDE